MTEYTGWKISTGIMTGNVIQDSGLDEDESIGRLKQQTCRALEAAFPGADVEIPVEHASGCIPFGLQTHVYPPTDLPADTDELEQSVDRICEAVFERQQWYVYLLTWGEALSILDDGTADADRKGQAMAVVCEAVNAALPCGPVVDQDWIDHGDYTDRPSAESIAAEWRELCAEVERSI